jgi:membrane protease YdiL (CAAX protease family)
MTTPRALALVVLNALVSFVALGVFADATGEDPFVLTPRMLAAFLVSFAVSAVGLVWFASVRQPRRTWRELGWRFDGLPLALAKGVGGGVVALGFIVALRAVFGATLQETFDAMLGGPAAQHAMPVLIGLDAAFVEESLFRGNLQPLLERRLGRAAGLVLTALIFSAYHLNPRPLALLGKFVLGLWFGLLRGRDGTLVVPAVAHFMVWAFAGAA